MNILTTFDIGKWNEFKMQVSEIGNYTLSYTNKNKIHRQIFQLKSNALRT